MRFYSLEDIRNQRIRAARRKRWREFWAQWGELVWCTGLFVLVLLATFWRLR